MSAKLVLETKPHLLVEIYWPIWGYENLPEEESSSKKTWLAARSIGLIVQV